MVHYQVSGERERRPGVERPQAELEIYIAAALYPLLGECTAVWLSWLDDVQPMALDETEPNYRRIRLDGDARPLVADHGERPEEFSLFTSRGAC